MKRLNEWLAAKITGGVGTMWCAWAFCALAFVSLPAAIATGDKIVIVSWIAQTFLQLVLLPIIIVGQNLQSAKADDHQASLDSLHVKHDELKRHLTARRRLTDPTPPVKRSRRPSQ